MYVLKQGSMIVKKLIKIESTNYWPVNTKEWEYSKTNQNFRKELFKIEVGKFFALAECISQTKMTSSVIADQDNVVVLCVNRTDILQIFSNDEIISLLGSTANVVIPEKSDVIQKAIVDSKAERIKARAMRQIATSLIKYRTENQESALNTHQSNVSHSEEKNKSRTPSAFGFRRSEIQNKESNPNIKYMNKLTMRLNQSHLRSAVTPNKTTITNKLSSGNDKNQKSIKNKKRILNAIKYRDFTLKEETEINSISDLILTQIFSNN